MWKRGNCLTFTMIGYYCGGFQAADLLQRLSHTNLGKRLRFFYDYQRHLWKNHLKCFIYVHEIRFSLAFGLHGLNDFVCTENFHIQWCWWYSGSWFGWWTHGCLPYFYSSKLTHMLHSRSLNNNTVSFNIVLLHLMRWYRNLTLVYIN